MMRVPAAAVLLAALFATAASWAAPARTMKAAVVVDGLTVIRQLPVPTAARGEVLVRVNAAAVNPLDWRSAAVPPGAPDTGVRPIPPAPLPGGPRIPGVDASGVIAAVGPGVTGWKVGDEVIALAERAGTYADYVCVSADCIALKPSALTFEQAAGIPNVACAAWAVLVDVAGIKAGDRVLVHAGAGGTGSAAVQIAKSRGAHVIATASTRNHEFLAGLGADEMIDYTLERFEDRVRDVDIVFNNVDTDTANRSVRVVRKGGIIVYITGTIDADRVTAAGIRASGRRTGGTPIGECLRQVAAMASEGRYNVNVDRTFALSDVGRAWDYSKEGHTRGKIIIRLN